jgi:Doubled CXXCH motif (Paired_CXXCH_1)
MPPQLQNVANIQCENCHGAGSEHVNNGGAGYALTVPTGSGACAQCHDDPSHHIKFATWSNSAHAVTTRDPAGNATCVGCHTMDGFMGRVAGATTLNTTYGAINCETCHEPHGQTIPSTAAHLLRTVAPVTLADGTQVSNAGMGTLCMNCHQSREKAAVYAATTAGTTYFGPHEGPQADMLEGVNGFTYGQTIASFASHASAITDTCVTCHMQTASSSDPNMYNVGDHTFNISYTPQGSSTPDQLVAACQTCHGSEATSLNIDGVQTEVQNLLDQLSAMLPPAGQPKTSLNIDSTWTQPQLEAAYNWLFVHNDGSLGVHNAAYAEGLLNASIANLQKTTSAGVRK